MEECGDSGEGELEECGESGEGASVNAYQNSEKLRVQYGPTAAGWRSVLPPISKNEVDFYRCARARPRTSQDMDGALHTDFANFYTI